MRYDLLQYLDERSGAAAVTGVKREFSGALRVRVISHPQAPPKALLARIGWLGRLENEPATR
jgi:hypothetical protein